MILLLWILNMFAILAATAGVVDDLLVPARFEAAEGVGWDDLVAETGLPSVEAIQALASDGLIRLVPIGKGRYKVPLADLRAHQTFAKRLLDSPLSNVLFLLATAACAGVSLTSAAVPGWTPWLWCALGWAVQLPGYALGFWVMWQHRKRLLAEEDEPPQRTGTGYLS